MTLPAGSRGIGPVRAVARPQGYGTHVRSELIGALGGDLGRVLDVGCATGAGSELLRAHGATWLAGVEIDEGFAARAAERYDEVVGGSVEEELPWEPRSFDTVLCYDVLEHLVDPWTTVARLAALLRPGGRFHASVPNARHPGTWLPLVLRGTFAYRAEGLRDVGHLRFFARHDLRALLAGGGLEVQSIEVVPAPARSMNLALKLSRGRAAEFAAYQWMALATA